MTNESQAKKAVVKFVDVAVAEDYQLACQYTQLLNDNSIKTIIIQKNTKKLPFAIQVRISDHKRAWKLIWSELRSDDPVWKSA